MKLTNEIFSEICNHKNPGEILDGAEYLKNGWMDTSDIYRFLDIIYSVTKYTGGKPKVLELGVSDGTSSLAFLKALAEMDGPPMDAVDYDLCQGLSLRLVNHFELKPWWNFHNKKTDQFFATNKETYDIIFIDADHTYVGAKFDFDNAVKILNPGGIIMIHDAFMNNCAGFDGCGRIVYDVLKDPAYNCFVSTIPHCMAFIQKKEDVLKNFPWGKNE